MKSCMVKKLWLTVITLLLMLPAYSRPLQDTTFVFYFQPGDDVFYVPYRNNDTELQRLADTLEKQREFLEKGVMYMSVSSYAATGKGNRDATRIAYLRCSRIKSELVIHHRAFERMFVTDKHITPPYGDNRLHNVVVVTLPATVEKIEQIAGKETADKVRAYYKEHSEKPALQDTLSKKEIIREPTAYKAATDDQPLSRAVQESNEPKETFTEVSAPETVPFRKLALRANLLRWATLTPDLGMEWRLHRNWSVLINGIWTSWSWEDKNRRYALWVVSPEIRYHLGAKKRGYIGAMYHIGEFNYKLNDTGKQGDLMGGGITCGYLLELNRSLSLDFSLGVGCTHTDYERYTVTDGVRVKQGREDKNYWGVNHAGITLVWKLK